MRTRETLSRVSAKDTTIIHSLFLSRTHTYMLDRYIYIHVHTHAHTRIQRSTNYFIIRIFILFYFLLLFFLVSCPCFVHFLCLFAQKRERETEIRRFLSPTPPPRTYFTLSSRRKLFFVKLLFLFVYH